jgi:hypothetical protein
MTRRILTFALLFTVCFTAFGQADKEYSKTLKKMFEVSGSEESYQAAIKQMFTMFKQQYSNVKPDVWDDFEKEFSKTSLNDLTEMLVPVYFKYMTLSDLQELIKQESMQIGQQWGIKLGQDFEKKMKEKGY